MRFFLSLVLLSFLLPGCWNVPERQTAYNLRPGDILFQDLDCGPACDAIESVTEGVDGWDFSHCGIVAEVDGELKVVEAYGKVQAVSIDSFLARSKDRTGKPKVLAGRVKDNEALAVQAAELCRAYLGKEYDKVFRLGDDAYYCSELVYECYKKANGENAFFPLKAMTFKTPGADSFVPFWTEYYHNLGAEIPEGAPGINPGAISRSPHLEILEINKQ